MRLDSHLVSNLTQPIHIIGIGGIGMSGLAKLLQQNHYIVQGSDIRENSQIKELRKLGIKIFLNHSETNINNSGLIVKSSAIKGDNIEIKGAKDRLIPVITRAELLSGMLQGSYNICITGAHGKTSTTALIYNILKHHNRNATVICGGIINAINSNVYNGDGSLSVVEADESDGTFLILPTDIGVITNIDNEHLDYYKSIENIINIYKLFIQKVLLKDLLIACDDCEYLSQINKSYLNNPKYITYGIDSKNADIRAINIRRINNSSIFDILISHKFQQKLKTSINIIKNVKVCNLGKHNILNSLAGVGVALFQEGKEEIIKTALFKNLGVKRRFSILGKKDDMTFVDDYAHHPSEIKSTLNVAKEYISSSNGKIFVIFQPHRYSRLKELYKQFLKSFKNADYVLILDVYSAEEKEIPSFNSKRFTDDIGSISKSFYCHDNREIVKIIRKYKNPGAYLIFMGAGNISEIAHEVFASYKN